MLHARATAEEAFLHRILRLPPAARTALLLAALDEDAALETLVRACSELGIDASAFGAAEAAGLLTVTETHIAFHHPARSIGCRIRRAARLKRRAAHAALARALVGPSTADRRAWHLARAAAAPEEQARRGFGRGSRPIARPARSRDGGARLRASRAAHARSGGSGPPTSQRRRRRPISQGTSALRSTTSTRRAPRRRRGPLAEIEHLRGRVAARMGSAAAAREVLVAAADRCEQEDPGSAALILADAVIPACEADDRRRRSSWHGGPRARRGGG